jgi:hypothetical protein
VLAAPENYGHKKVSGSVAGLDPLKENTNKPRQTKARRAAIRRSLPQSFAGLSRFRIATAASESR